jgi:hypothetical protein
METFENMQKPDFYFNNNYLVFQVMKDSFSPKDTPQINETWPTYYKGYYLESSSNIFKDDITSIQVNYNVQTKNVDLKTFYTVFQLHCDKDLSCYSTNTFYTLKSACFAYDGTFITPCYGNSYEVDYSTSFTINNCKILLTIDPSYCTITLRYTQDPKLFLYKITDGTFTFHEYRKIIY